MGRTSLMMVMGFNLIFMFMGFNLSKITTKAYDNYLNYYEMEQARYIASSAANIAVGSICKDTGWTPSNTSFDMNGGTFSFQKKRSIVGIQQQVKVICLGEFKGYRDSTVITLTLGRFSEFAFYSQIENNLYWITGDTCWGPLHSQQRLNVSGSPVFMSKVTTKNGINKGNNDNPVFNGGYTTGVNISLPADFTPLKIDATSAGKVWSNSDIYIEFRGDGKIVVRNGSWTATPTTYNSLSALSSNGVLLCDNGNLHIKGKVSGKMTIGATGSSGASKGNVYVDSSITYAHNPLLPDGHTTDESCPDMLGIISDNNVIVSNNTNNANGVTIHGSIMARKGGLTAENYNQGSPRGTLTVVGGIQQNNREPVGTFNSSTNQIQTGYQKNYKFDKRFASAYPPSYPQREKFNVLSWYDRISQWKPKIWESD